MGDLEGVFKSFCAFGGGKGEAPLMDNAKFAKFFRDLKLLDKALTSTDVDIIFSKCKEKSERKITFAQFQKALELAAQTKYPGDRNGYRKLVGKVVSGKGPVAAGTTKVHKDDVLDRLTDTSKYTGSHKERFDESGKGKGLAGRDSAAKGGGMSAGCVGAQASYVQGYRHEGTYEKKVKQ